jgi:quercetin dioxygenase-like cupin family protein
MAHAKTHESVPYRGTLEIVDRYGIASSPPSTAAAEDALSPIQIETLIESTCSWDGMPYEAYPAGRPQITIFKITISPHTTMKWHSHPHPIAGYILSGQLTIEKEDGTKQHLVAGQAVTETVNCVHRGITGAEPTMLLAFCPGIPGLPISR